MESLDNVLAKKGSIKHLWEVIDPENKYPYKICIEEWYRMSLSDQRKLYLYVLYKKWRGETFYGTPYDIITNCHPYPTNWNGRTYLNTLMKSTTKMVIALFNGSYGTYTLDEARVWEMTIKQPLNFKSLWQE